MKKQSILHNLYENLLVIIPVFIGLIIIFRFAAPFGMKVTYNYNISQNAELFGRIRNIERSSYIVVDKDRLEVKDRFNVTKERMEFSLSVPKDDFATVKMRIKLGKVDNKTTLLNIDKTRGTDSVLIRSTELSQLGYKSYEYNGYSVWAFNEAIDTEDKLKLRIFEDSKSSKTYSICSLGNKPEHNPIIEGEVYNNKPTTYSISLRGGHTFATYVDESGLLKIAFNKQDLNWYSGADEIRVVLKYGQTIISEEVFPDDGIVDGKQGRGVSFKSKIDVSKSGLSKGVYYIEVIANEDTLLTDFELSNSKFVIVNEVFMANSPLYGEKRPKALIYSRAERAFISFYHDSFKNFMAINGEIFVVGTAQQYETFEMKNDIINAIELEDADLRISSNDYFAFSGDGYFKPSIFSVLDCTLFPADIIKKQDALMVKYQAVEISEGTYEFTIPFKTEYVFPDGRIYFTLFNPGIGNDQQRIEIQDLLIEFEK